ncbi:MAG: protein kinase [Verrucomicrobiota bacterium]|jgi:WD40 repeat protein/class 3 adenylate cyclase/tRNA A-37 threonylcarbamoyl transferase component Bud32
MNLEDQSGPGADKAVGALQAKGQTGLVTLLFTDIVASTALKQQLGDKAAVELLERHQRLVRETLRQFPGGQEIATAGDSFFFVFTTPSAAVKFALRLQWQLRRFNQGLALGVQDRVGIHLGEVVIRERAEGNRPQDLYGLHVDAGARVMGLAQGGQILLSRGVFDSARQTLKGEELPELGGLCWLNHGPFLLKGIEEPVEICEVFEATQQPLPPPTTSDKAHKVAAPAEEPVLGWRPAVGVLVPNTQWRLTQKLGEGGFGEVWLGRHETMKERRVFKFCFRADRVRALKREMTLFRLIKERIGDHPNIVRLLEVYFEAPPYYVEEEYVAGQDLRSWCEGQGGAEKLPLGVKLEVVAQTAEALQAAHDAGVIHRDVKPGNILISQGPGPGASLAAKLTDFGIGQVVSAEALAGVTKAGFTQTMLGSDSSSQTGTQLYMAPELLAGKPASTRSDIYSLGVVLYQLLVGDFTRPVTSDWAEDITEPLLRADLKHCLAGKPAERFAGATQLAQSLRALDQRRATQAQEQAALAAAERKAYRRGVARAAGIAATILGLVTLLAVVAAQQARRAARQRERAEASEQQARQNAYAWGMGLAFAALEENNLGRAAQLLEQNRPRPGEADQRGWEWRYLWRQCRSDELATLGRHGHYVHSVAFSADGKWLASGGRDGIVKIWDVSERRLVTDLVHTGYVYAVVFSPDGRWLATGSGGPGETAVIWTTTNWQRSLALPAKTRVGALAFSPDGLRLAWLDDDGVTLWALAAQRAVAHWPGYNELMGTPRLAFSPDGRRLAWVASAGLAVCDLASGAAPLIFSGSPSYRDFAALAFAPNGNRLAGARWDNLISVWDLLTRGEVARLTNHTAWVSSLAFSPDGTRLASAGADQRVLLWDTSTWQPSTVLKGHRGEIWALAMSPDGKLLATGGKDDTVRLWSTALPAQEPNELRGARAFIHPSGRFCAKVWSEASGIIVDREFYDVTTLRPLMPRLGPPPADMVAAGFTADGKWFAVGLDNGSIWIAQLPSGQEACLRTNGPPVSSLEFSNDGTWLVCIGGQQIQVWDFPHRRPTVTLPPFPNTATRVSFSGDGESFALGASDGLVRVWATRTGRALLTLKAHRDVVRDVALSSNGHWLATAGWDATVKLIEVAGRSEPVQLVGARLSYHAVAFSPDDRRLAAGTGEGSIKIWDVASRQEVATLRGHTHFVTQVAFHPAGDLLISSTWPAGGPVRVWRAAPLAEVDRLEVAPGR